MAQDILPVTRTVCPTFRYSTLAVALTMLLALGGCGGSGGGGGGPSVVPTEPVPSAAEFEAIMESISMLASVDNGDGHLWTFRKTESGEWSVEGARGETATVTSAGANRISIDGFPAEWGADGTYVFTSNAGTCSLDSQDSVTHHLQWPCDISASQMAEIDFGVWETIVVDGISVGFTNTTHGLSARWDTSGANPTITATSPMQPTVEGTWTGMWGGFVGEELDTVDEGTAEVNVSIRGDDVHATLTYNDIDGIGNVTTGRTRVDPTGRFSPSATVTVDGVPLRYTGEGQFGGEEQRGVVGHMSGTGLRSVFYGDRTN